MRCIMSVVSLLLLAGCASIVTGNSEKISIATTPAGAKCTLSRHGQVIAVVDPTPGAATIERGSRDILVTCTKQGYGTAIHALHSEMEAATLGNILIGGVIGIGIDAATGANERYPSSDSLTMVPASTGSVSAAAPGVGLASAGSTSASAASAASANTSAAGGADVPFSIDLAGNSYDGIAKLEKGHISGQLEAFGKPVNLTGEMNGNSVSARLVGALGAQQGNWGGGQCVADGEASPASGAVAIPMQASCPLHDYSIVLHLNLPAASG